MKNIRQSLLGASSLLLGLSATSQASEDWRLDVGLMNYVEQDRNVGLELLLNAQRDLSDGDQINLGVEIDTLTGATPNGATASNVPQTFTQSSGAGSYQVAANQLPADDTHMDTRLAIAAAYKDRISNNIAITYKGRLSMEFDYLSFGAGNSYQWDLNNQNTSLTIDFNGEYNRVHPVGNIPVPLSLMTAPGSLQNRGIASDSRSAAEVGLGLTQIIDRRSLVQIRYTQSHFSGYLNDPYKILSIVDDQNSASLGATLAYRFENRPETRDISTLYLAYKHNIDSGVIDLSLRRSVDDWEISSTTFELRYRHQLEGKAYLQPRLRYYRQDQASFFRHSLTTSQTLPSYASADTRLASFNATTIGVKYGSTVIDNKRHSIVAEYYTQTGDSHPDNAVGIQRQQNLFPKLRTIIIKYIYSTEF